MPPSEARAGEKAGDGPTRERPAAAPGGPGGDAGVVEAGPALERRDGDRPEISVLSLSGRVPYREGLELQRSLARARIEGTTERDLLLLLEHAPVLTLGRDADEGHLRAGPERLEELGVDVVEIERGGDVTYHGPGQLVGYPVLDLRAYRQDLHWYLRAVEEALVRALGELGLPAFRVPEHTGVWVGDRSAVAAPVGASVADAAVLDGRIRKIASIGVHVSRWVTWHGFALNVTEEPMENFRLIVPCGIRGVRMTSLRGEGLDADARRVRAAVADGFASVFGARLSGSRPPAEAEELAEPAGGSRARSPAGGKASTMRRGGGARAGPGGDEDAPHGGGSG